MQEQRLVDTVLPGDAEENELPRVRSTNLCISILSGLWRDSLSYTNIRKYRNIG